LPELPFFFFNNSGNGYFAADKKISLLVVS